MLHENTSASTSTTYEEQVKAVVSSALCEIAKCNERVSRRTLASSQSPISQSAQELLLAVLQVKRFSSCKSKDASILHAVVARAAKERRPVPITILCGPLKNRKLNRAQHPDWAEIFQYAQLARYHQAIQEVYPLGIEIELLLDDARAEYANQVPRNIFEEYAQGVSSLLASLQLSSWIRISSLYPVYEQLQVRSYFNIANRLSQKVFDTYSEEDLAEVTRNAWENIDDAVDPQEAVRRYFVAQKAESLAGFWNNDERIILRYGRSPASVQRLWSVRKGSSDLPWQGIGGVAQFEDKEFRPCVWQQYRSCSLQLNGEVATGHHIPGIPEKIPFFKSLCAQSGDSKCMECPIQSSYKQS